MKSFFLFITALLLLLPQKGLTQAPPGNVGIKVGLASTGFTGTSSDLFQSTTGSTAMMYYVPNWMAAGEQHFFVLSEFGISQKGATPKTASGYAAGDDFKLTYLDLTVVPKYCFNGEESTPFLNIGGFVSVHISGGPTSINAPAFNSLDYGYLLGAGYDLGKPEHGVNERQFGLEIRFMKSLCHVFQSSSGSYGSTAPGDLDVSNQSIGIMLRLYLFNA